MSALSQLRGRDLSRIDQGGDLWHLYRQACAESLYFFSKNVWTQVPQERNLLSARTFLPLCLLLEDDANRVVLIEDPRRHLKSTIGTKSTPVHKLVRMVVAEQDPSIRFGLYSSTTINSQRQWREIKWGFENNQWFQFLFPELVWESWNDAPIWNTEEGVVKRLYNPQEPTFDTLGGGKATGRHYDWIIEDDLINESNFDSPAAVEMAIEYHRQATHLLEGGPEDRKIIVGNRWGMNDLNAHIHQHEPDAVIFSRSVWGPRLDGRWCSRNLPPRVEELLRQLPSGEPIWPERFDKEKLGLWMREVGPRIWSAQALNNPSDPDSADFKVDWLKECELQRTDTGWQIVYSTKSGTVEEVVPLSATNLYIAWDPALDGKHSTSRNAILVTSIDAKGRVCILREWAKKADPLDMMDVFLDAAQLYKGYLKNSGLEEVLFQKVLGKLLRERSNQRGIYLGLKALKTPRGQSKDQRIRALVGTLFQDGRVYVRRGLTDFIEEYTNFGVEGMTNDLMDCFAYSAQLWSKPLSKHLTDEMEEREEERRENLGITGYGSALRRRRIA